MTAPVPVAASVRPSPSTFPACARRSSLSVRTAECAHITEQLIMMFTPDITVQKARCCSQVGPGVRGKTHPMDTGRAKATDHELLEGLTRLSVDQSSRPST